MFNYMQQKFRLGEEAVGTDLWGVVPSISPLELPLMFGHVVFAIYNRQTNRHTHHNTCIPPKGEVTIL